MLNKYIYQIKSIDNKNVIYINFYITRYKSVAISNFERQFPDRKIYNNLNLDIEGIKRIGVKQFKEIVLNIEYQRKKAEEKERVDLKKKLQQFAVENKEQLKQFKELGITFNPF